MAFVSVKTHSIGLHTVAVCYITACILTYIHTHTYTHTNIHTHIHTYMHTYTYIHTYTLDMDHNGVKF